MITTITNIFYIILSLRIISSLGGDPRQCSSWMTETCTWRLLVVMATITFMLTLIFSVCLYLMTNV